MSGRVTVYDAGGQQPNGKVIVYLELNGAA